METLSTIYESYKGPASYGDKGTIHSYIEVYEQLLAPFRHTAQRVLEIGVLGGHSIRMWEKYFTQAKVHGVDLNLTPLDMFDLRPMLAEGGHLLHFFDITDPAQVETHLGGFLFDVIIDDGSHILAHQLAAYQNLRAHLSASGLYVIEDIENIDQMRPDFLALDPDRPIEIIDRRGIKGRFDDVLVILRGPQAPVTQAA